MKIIKYWGDLMMNIVMGLTTDQIKPWEPEKGIYEIISGGHKTIPKELWFINYKGNGMEL